MQPTYLSHDLTEIAKQSLLEHHFLPDYPLDVQREIDQIEQSATPLSPQIHDLRNLLWFSLDNDDSRDLDQLTYAEKLPDHYKIYIAIADVDSLVKKGSAIDHFAQQNTTSIYTPTKVFPMLPEKLSTQLTSLNEGENRLAIIVEIEVKTDGSLGQSTLYQGYVHNYAKLAYNRLADWLDGKQPIPDRIKQVPGMEQQVKLQDKIAYLLKAYRHEHGALTLQTIEPFVVIENEEIIDLKSTVKNRAKDLIEEFMVAANTATAHFLIDHHLPSLRRVVRTPKRWDRIVEIAAQYQTKLPPHPDSKALELFLIKRRLLDPLHFPDLSLTIIKLLGNGEYIVEYPGNEPIGHFSLALKHYMHSTAPNRRFPDLITQRMIKSALNHEKTPYTPKELEILAKQCTQKEDEAEKIERKMKKSAAIVLLSSKINETFDALITGINDKGTWVRVLHPPVEGKLIKGGENFDVGDFIRVKLVHVDMEQGFIDFVKA